MSKPVLFFNAPRAIYRPVLVEQGEMYVSRAPGLWPYPHHQRKPGPYDVAAMLKELPAEYHEPSLVMCQWDFNGQCEPRNLAAVKCPKVLLIADTHHGNKSLTRAIKLAMAEPWDLIVLEFNQQHCHWFADFGIHPNRIAYIPCFTINPIDLPVPDKRTRGVTFCGSAGQYHIMRRNILVALQQRLGPNIQIEHHGGNQEYCAKIYNESVVSLNISLNGDFNLRNMEIAAAGGFAVSDSVSGCQDANFGDRFHSLHDACVQIRRALEYPDDTLAYARHIREWFWASHSPAKKIEQLHAALRGENMGWEYQPSHSPWTTVSDRLSVYEQVQDLVRQGRIHWEDFKDLPRWVA